MPTDLLHELMTALPIAKGLDQVCSHLSHAQQELAETLEAMVGSVEAFEKVWRLAVLAVAAGDTSAVQAKRPELLSTFEERLHLLKRCYALGTRLRTLEVEGCPDPDTLLPEIAGMERLKARVFELWQTAEDLEDLAARDYPLTTADLDQTGPQNHPPASFYAEDSKPF